MRTGYRSPCDRWRKYIFATTQARDAHGQPRADVDGNAFREKWKRPFRKKLPLQYLKEKRDLQSPKFGRIGCQSCCSPESIRGAGCNLVGGATAGRADKVTCAAESAVGAPTRAGSILRWPARITSCSQIRFGRSGETGPPDGERKICPRRLSQIIVRFDQNEARRIADKMPQPKAMPGPKRDDNAIAGLCNLRQLGKNLRVA